jgi:hypothetical protein
MKRIMDAEDLLDAARDCIGCVEMAAADPGYTSIQTVAAIAREKIDEAIELLIAYRAEMAARPEPWLAKAEDDARRLQAMEAEAAPTAQDAEKMLRAKLDEAKRKKRKDK